MIYGYLITGKPFIPDNYNNNTDLDLTVRYIQWYPEKQWNQRHFCISYFFFD